MNNTLLIAPCGMNCGICMAYLREKNKCPGCRVDNIKKPVTRANCKIKNCPVFKENNSEYCFECEKFPCEKLKHLDKRYRLKYKMSMIGNLEYIKKSGIKNFIRNENTKWRCPDCGGKICVHSGNCSHCGRLRRI